MRVDGGGAIDSRSSRDISLSSTGRQNYDGQMDGPSPADSPFSAFSLPFRLSAAGIFIPKCGLSNRPPQSRRGKESIFSNTESIGCPEQATVAIFGVVSNCRMKEERDAKKSAPASGARRRGCRLPITLKDVKYDSNVPKTDSGIRGTHQRSLARQGMKNLLPTALPFLL